MNDKFEPACRRMEWLDPFYKAVWEKAFADAIPISGTFELTPRCNFNCRMCYVHLKPSEIHKYGKELTAKEWIRVAREAKEAGTTWLCITGGEPLMHPEFETIWKELTQMGFFITLQTNASMIEGKLQKLLEDYPPKGVKITLYGSNDEIYEQVCQVPNGFTKVDQGIRTLKEMKIPIQLVSTIIRQNEEDVKRMAFYALKNGMKWNANGGIQTSIRGTDSEARKVRIQEKLDAERYCEIRYRIKYKKFVDINRKPCTYCKDYRLGYWVTWNGDIRFCSFMNEPNYSIKDLPFIDAWKKLISYEEKLDWPEECFECEANIVCFKCIGSLSAMSGSPHLVKKEFCNKIKNYYLKEKGSGNYE